MRKKVYGIVENTTSIIVKKLCVPIRKHLKPLIMLKLIMNKIKQITSSFESLHKSPYSTIGAISCSHVSTITPNIKSKSNYSHKGFYSTWIQGVVKGKYIFLGL
jgi:hypothetical protein